MDHVWLRMHRSHRYEHVYVHIDRRIYMYVYIYMCVCNTCNDYSIFPARNPGGMVALVFQTGPNRLHQQTKAVRDQTSPVLVTSGVLNEHIIQIRQRVEHDKALLDAIHNGFPWHRLRSHP